jgi:hypothetical protein
VRRLFFGIVLALFTVACSGSKSPVAPTPTPPAPVIPACQANHTAAASFRNAGGRVVDVIMDGGVLGTLGIGETGLARTIAASVAHDIKFRITNKNTIACGAFNPIPVECSSPVYATCTF